MPTVKITAICRRFYGRTPFACNYLAVGMASCTLSGGRVLSTCTGVERSVYWADGALYTIDQKLLPGEFKVVSSASVADVVAKIKDMTVRGAPAIGAAGAFAMALAANASAAASA